MNLFTVLFLVMNPIEITAPQGEGVCLIILDPVEGRVENKILHFFLNCV